MAGKIVADTIESAGSQISLNVGNVTVLTASSTGLTLTPTNNVNINVTNSTLAFGAGNVSFPSITASGDTNTGLYFPAADQIGIVTGGVAALSFSSTQVPTFAKAASGGRTVQVFTSGSGTYTSPAGVKSIKITLVGGGGGGGGINGSGAAGGGAGGATALWMFPSGFAAQTGYAYAVGAGGAGGVSSSASTGSTGGSTTFTIGATTVTAAGGNGGSGSLGGTAAGGIGGTATNGTVNIEGGVGGESYGPSLLGGTGGSSTMGGGARQAFGTATAGGNYCVGGAGAVNNAALVGGAGAGGIIIVEEFYI